MADVHGGDQAIDLSVSSPQLAAPVLERLVSAAATRAEMPVDRVVNALTVVDVLVHATDSVLTDGARDVRVSFSPGKIALVVGNLVDGQAEAIRDAATLPGVGNALERIASSVEIEREGLRSALVVSLD